MLATANKHSLPEFDELLFVWPLAFILPGMGVPIKRFYPLPVCFSGHKANKLSYHDKVHGLLENNFYVKLKSYITVLAVCTAYAVVRQIMSKCKINFVNNEQIDPAICLFHLESKFTKCDNITY